MRKDGGMKAIEDACKKLGERHEEHILVYGEGNAERMTGEHETAAIDKFSYGVANRGASIRIPRQCAKEGKGYLEDRRPASNACPYRITGIIMETVSIFCLFTIQQMLTRPSIDFWRSRRCGFQQSRELIAVACLGLNGWSCNIRLGLIDTIILHLLNYKCC